ncbi:MAG: cupin domain-containing protein [Kiritimatiellae bacterium]|nr:cupin domain-containing protein [Kiritimatiellia bacterium]
MYHVNWKTVEPVPAYNHTCFRRDLLGEILPTPEERKRFEQYVSVARACTITPHTAMQRHRHNFGEFIYVLNGRGTVEAGGVRKTFKPRDAIQIPADTPHALGNEDDNQVVTLLSLGWLGARAGQEPATQDAGPEEGPTLDRLRLYNWYENESFKLGHGKTLWWTEWGGQLGQTPAERMFLAHFTGVSVVGTPLKPDQHPKGEIYFVDQGRGVIGVEGEETDVEEGSMVLIPGNAVHTVRSTLPDQQLNLLIIATYSELEPFRN